MSVRRRRQSCRKNVSATAQNSKLRSPWRRLKASRRRASWHESTRFTRLRISQWKRQLLEALPEVFRNGKVSPEVAEHELTAPLFEEIGRLKMELDWVKKVLPSSTAGGRMLIQPNHSEISVTRQCELMGLPRSSYYYEPVGESAYNLELMRFVDEQYICAPRFSARAR